MRHVCHRLVWMGIESTFGLSNIEIEVGLYIFRHLAHTLRHVGIHVHGTHMHAQAHTVSQHVHGTHMHAQAHTVSQHVQSTPDSNKFLYKHTASLHATCRLIRRNQDVSVSTIVVP